MDRRPPEGLISPAPLTDTLIGILKQDVPSEHLRILSDTIDLSRTAREAAQAGDRDQLTESMAMLSFHADLLDEAGAGEAADAVRECVAYKADKWRQSAAEASDRYHEHLRRLEAGSWNRTLPPIPEPEHTDQDPQPSDPDQDQDMAGAPARDRRWMTARRHLLDRGYIGLLDGLFEADDTAATGWRQLTPHRITAEIRQYLHANDPKLRTVKAALIREVGEDTRDQGRPAGANLVDTDRARLVHLDRDEVLEGRLWANARIVYTGGKVTAQPLPEGRVWTGSGRLPFAWSDAHVVTPRVRGYLDTLELPDDELDYLLALIGRGLLQARDGGSPLPCLVGQPTTGKSTLLRLIRRVLHGPAADGHSVSGLARRFGLAELLTCSTLVLDDLAEARTADFRAGAKILCRIADGSPIEIEAKRRNVVTIRPAVSVWLSGNTAPLDVRSKSDGLGRRVRVIALTARFDPTGPDPLADITARDIEALANYCARAWPRWAHRPPPQSITDRTAEEMDRSRAPLDRFLDRFRRATDGHTVSGPTLQEEYAAEYGEPITGQALGQAIGRRFGPGLSTRAGRGNSKHTRYRIERIPETETTT